MFEIDVIDQKPVKGQGLVVHIPREIQSGCSIGIGDVLVDAIGHTWSITDMRQEDDVGLGLCLSGVGYVAGNKLTKR
jgi:hypothetical protein